MSTPQPSKEELLGHHYANEVNSLQAVYNRMGSETDAYLKNALSENFAIHARVLLEFFEKPKGAHRHAPSYTSWSGGQKDTWRQRLNNQVAHLLDGRTADPAMKIDDDERYDLYVALRNETVRFKAALAKDEPNIVVPELALLLKVIGVGPTNAIIILKSLI